MGIRLEFVSLPFQPFIALATPAPEPTTPETAPTAGRTKQVNYVRLVR